MRSFSNVSTTAADLSKRAIRSQFGRFIVSGGINTASTYAIYLLLLRWISYKESYTVAYIAGIVLSYFLNRVFVFGTHQGVRTALLFPLVYLAQYLGGLLVLWIWIEILGLGVRFGPIAVVLTTLPMTYVLTKIFFTARR